MVRNAGSANRTQKDRVKVLQDFKSVIRHHLPGLKIIAAAPGKVRKGKCKSAVDFSRCLQYLHCFRDYFGTDAVACDYRNPVCLHDPVSLLTGSGFSVFPAVLFPQNTVFVRICFLRPAAFIFPAMDTIVRFRDRFVKRILLTVPVNR